MSKGLIWKDHIFVTLGLIWPRGLNLNYAVSNVSIGLNLQRWLGSKKTATGLTLNCSVAGKLSST